MDLKDRWKDPSYRAKMLPILRANYLKLREALKNPEIEARRKENHRATLTNDSETVKRKLMENRKIEGECWIWIGAIICDQGYGTITYGEEYLVHRVAYTIFKGPIPEGLFVLHKCDHPPCFNPDHLFLGTQSDNMRDAMAKGRLKPFQGDK